MPQSRVTQFIYQKTRFAPEDALELVKDEEKPQELLVHGRGLSNQVNRLLLSLEEFLDQAVTNPLMAGFGAPNLTRNGNFLNQDGAAEAPGYIPNGWDTPFVATLLVLPIVVFCNTLSFAGGIGGGLLAFEYLWHHVLGAAPGDGARLGIALPILLTVSKIYAMPWLFRIGKSK